MSLPQDKDDLEALYAAQDHRTLRVMAVTDGGLGYDNWLKLNGFGTCDVIYADNMHGSAEPMAMCHPAIRATQKHADAIEGVFVGDIICGVRWWEAVDFDREIDPLHSANKPWFRK